MNYLNKEQAVLYIKKNRELNTKTKKEVVLAVATYLLGSTGLFSFLITMRFK